MAEMDKDPVAQPPSNSSTSAFDRRVSRSPLSVAFDAASSRTLSSHLEYGGDSFTLSVEKDFHGPFPHTSFDPIVPRDAGFTGPNVVDWDGNEDPENPLYWPLRRKLWMSCVASLMAFTISLASSIFSADVHVTAQEFDVGEEVMVLGVSLYVLGFACGMKTCTTSIDGTTITDMQQAHFSSVHSASSTDDLNP